MKKIFLLFTAFFYFWIAISYNPADGLNKLEENFKPECYEYYKKINKENLNPREIYKIELDKTKNLVISQNGFILPYKYFGWHSKMYKYSNNLWLNNKYFSDYNYNTYHEINSKAQNEIILIFTKTLKKSSFDFVFRYHSSYYKPSFFIWNDLDNLDLISRQDIVDFSFKYLKIKFEPINQKKLLENIKIYELSFPQKNNTILLKSQYNSDIEFYSNFNCKNKDFSTKHKIQDYFSIDKNTKTLEINLEKNPKYNIYSKKDYDNDWVEDSLDNCKYIYNPKQRDRNWDWVWDLCSDDDKDWIIWNHDNCIYIKNSDQKDLNRNWVWDVCEFDKDKDSIFDSLDNCINIANPDQKDKDKDWIWDKCDNSIYYNPAQLDKNNNWIWDITEQKQKQLKKNDKDKDWIINWQDNCENVFNPDQKDIDQDWVWDACDNCKNIQNKNQLDLAWNWVWDICEDSDNDWIDWIKDNCINVANPNQKDDDNNGIWNLCEDKDGDKIIFVQDNCPYDYNPKQEDIDKDNKGDVCDLEDNRFIESNSSFFIIIVLLLVAVFLWAIYMMIRKLK